MSVTVPIDLGVVEQSQPVGVDVAIPADPVVPLDWVGRGVAVPVVPEDPGVPCVPVAPGAPFILVVSEVPCGF